MQVSSEKRRKREEYAISDRLANIISELSTNTVTLDFGLSVLVCCRASRWRRMRGAGHVQRLSN